MFVDATRTGGATVVAAYSPRVRPGRAGVVPGRRGTTSTTSRPADFTIHTALEQLGDRDPWADAMPRRSALPADLVAEGHEIPVARVAAMHEGKRRKRAAEKAAEQ